MAVMLQFPLGDVVVDLFDEGEGSTLCESFAQLCARKHYHGCLVYQVQPGCLAQLGDPSGTGTGGCCGAALAHGVDAAADRFMRHTPSEDRPKHDRAGLISLVSMGSQNGEHLYGSQFFFTLRDDDLEHLDAGGHVIIGEVAEGLDVLKKIGALYLDSSGRPWEDVRVQHAHVLENPFADIECPPSPTRNPETPHVEEKLVARVAYGQAKDPSDGLTATERASQEADKKARSQAEVLEMIGDLPHADVEVPKNELFIAKLNKATEDADLELIFSRFGRIESCDIVRDWKTGDSLNFAFIAFEEEKSCVEAYKKMNNVLIDDSRIRVDFSQSVAKIWSRYTMQYKGSAAAKLREKHRTGDKEGHYGPGGGSARAFGGRRGADDVFVAPPDAGHDTVRDYRARLEDRGDRRDDRRDRRHKSKASLGVEGLGRGNRRDRDRRDRDRGSERREPSRSSRGSERREPSRSSRGSERRERSRSRERSRRR